VASNGTLTTGFKEAGLGTGTTSVAITLSADASALYQCFNNGGNHPKAGNKETVNAELQASGNFPVSHGQTTASLSVGPPGPRGLRLPLRADLVPAVGDVLGHDRLRRVRNLDRLVARSDLERHAAHPGLA